MALLDDSPEKINVLARDIAEHGLSPAELLIVMQYDQRRYVVLEGNRRIAALKLLHSPKMAKGHPEESLFGWMKGHSNVITEVTCAVASSRLEARHWLELRHTGERGGAGVVPWPPSAQQRFSPSRGTHTDKAIKVIDFLRSSHPNDTELLEHLETIVAKKLTTFGRLVSDPYVRDILGIDLKRKDTITSDLRLLRLIRSVVSDLSDNLSVSDLKSKDQRRRYIDSIKTTSSAPSSSLPTKPTNDKGQSPARRKRSTPPPSFLLHDLELDNLGERVSSILKELQRLDVEQYPNAISVLIRCIVELSVDQFHMKRSWEPDRFFWKRIEKCVNEIDKSGKDNKYVPVRTGLRDQNSLLAARTLHGYVHNPYFHPTSTELRTIAKNYLPFLKALNERV